MDCDVAIVPWSRLSKRGKLAKDLGVGINVGLLRTDGVVVVIDSAKTSGSSGEAEALLFAELTPWYCLVLPADWSQCEEGINDRLCLRGRAKVRERCAYGRLS